MGRYDRGLGAMRYAAYYREGRLTLNNQEKYATERSGS